MTSNEGSLSKFDEIFLFKEEDIYFPDALENKDLTKEKILSISNDANNFLFKPAHIKRQGNSLLSSYDDRLPYAISIIHTMHGLLSEKTKKLVDGDNVGLAWIDSYAPSLISSRYPDYISPSQIIDNKHDSFKVWLYIFTQEQKELENYLKICRIQNEGLSNNRVSLIFESEGFRYIDSTSVYVDPPSSPSNSTLDEMLKKILKPLIT